MSLLRILFSRVMGQVFTYEALKRPKKSWSQNLLLKPIIRYALSFGGIALGIINLLRIYFAVFSPVVCK